MAADFYGTVAAVKLRTGVRPTDLGLEDDAELGDAIEALLAEATDLMNRKMRRSYNEEAEAHPVGLDGIANDMTAEALGGFIARRQTPVVRIDDFAVRQISSRMLTPDIVSRLRMYGRAGAGELTLKSEIRERPLVLDLAAFDAVADGE